MPYKKIHFDVLKGLVFVLIVLLFCECLLGTTDVQSLEGDSQKFNLAQVSDLGSEEIHVLGSSVEIGFGCSMRFIIELEGIGVAYECDKKEYRIIYAGTYIVSIRDINKAPGQLALN